METCDVCGGPVQIVRCKYICTVCGTINKSCADLATPIASEPQRERPAPT